jgi:uncharacterized protein (DUF433 family)
VEAEVTTDLIHDRGRGPEIVGTRITVYNLLDYFIDPDVTEAYICRVYDLTPEQVAAARAYVLTHPDTVLAQHLKIEERITAGNPPEVIEQAERTRDTFLRFKDWLAERERAMSQEQPAAVSAGSSAGRFPTFREWMAEQETRSKNGS